MDADHGPVRPDHVEAVRVFNRFYTRLLGLLHERIYAPEATLTEARVLWEIAQAPGITATDLVRGLRIDRGYLSRILERFSRRGLLEREAHAGDRRRKALRLTDAGRDWLARLESMSRQQVAGLLGALEGNERAELVWAMARIADILRHAEPEDADSPAPPEPGTDAPQDD